LKLGDVCVVVTSQNDAGTVRSCLESARGFGGRLVVDSFSSDGTVDIAREAGAVVYSRPLLDVAAQKNWAVSRAPTPWVLSVDACETVSESLRAEIERADAAAADGFVVRIENQYLGKLMCSVAASFEGSVRLFARGRGTFVADTGSPSGTSCRLEGRVADLDGALRRREFGDLHAHFEAINRETTVEARNYVKGGGKMAAARMLLQPVVRFWRLYLLRGGIRDGARGLMFCMLRAYASFITYAKAWEVRASDRRPRKKPGKESA
jgi:glycosyltransferase involved in cell wall biosynthesis